MNEQTNRDIFKHTWAYFEYDNCVINQGFSAKIVHYPNELISNMANGSFWKLDHVLAISSTMNRENFAVEKSKYADTFPHI